MSSRLRRNRQSGFTRICLGGALPGQLRIYGLESVEGQLLRLANIDPLELAVSLAIRSPVPLAPLVASPLFAHGVGAPGTVKSEEGGRLQPGIPGACSDEQGLLLSVLLIDEGLALDNRSCLEHDSALRSPRYSASPLSEPSFRTV